ncbi:Bromodomain-containing protein [Trametes cingulata]|nr:Bromodomain-containing protein [Trametes cingulata]
MSKREARSFAAAGVDIDAPRAKRRKEAPATTSTSPNGKRNASPANANGGGRSDAENAGHDGEDREAVREKGLQLWQTLKDAVNKEGQIASFQFMRLPSKRQYPDYYLQIKRPIALDDIKAKLEAREYATLEDVRQDLETCFRNAKRYNMKESQIWKDAKFLHKLATKAYSRITGTKEEPPADDGDERGASDDEGGGKKKAPNMHRLLKTRLQKLVDKTDENGRVLSAEFMELPSRKQWPMYYQIIKKPQALENIFKKLKRKEYHNPTDFANDVELVFSNALEFNQEHTQIWEDAVLLREYFRKLMADLPEPYSIPAYANAGEHPTKIKLKMPTAPTQPIAAPAPTLPSSNKIVVPGAAQVAVSSNASSSPKPQPQTNSAVAAPPPRRPPVVPAPLIHATSPQPATLSVAPTPAPVQAARTAPTAPTPPTPAATPTLQKAAHTGTLQPASFSQTVTPATYYPNAVYQQAPVTPVAPKASTTAPRASAVTARPLPPPVPIASLVPAAAVSRPSPPAASQLTHPLQHAVITTKPLGRRLVLHHEDGVKTWSMWLSGNESSIVLSDVTFLNRNDEGEESSGDEEHAEKPEAEGDASPPKRKRGRPPRKRAKAEASKKAKGKAAETSPGGVQVKLNGAVLQAKEGGEWEVPLPPGMSVLELGEKSGMVWKVYFDRAAY